MCNKKTNDKKRKKKVGTFHMFWGKKQKTEKQQNYKKVTEKQMEEEKYIKYIKKWGKNRQKISVIENV